MTSCRRAAPLAALGCAAAAALSCATLSEPAVPGPPAFAGVKRIALVRGRADRDAPRVKDALDALAESLSARGYEVKRVSLTGRPPAELQPAERLFSRVDAVIASAQPRPRFVRRIEAAGADAAETVRALGVDAVAMYHRFDDRLLMPLPDPVPGNVFPSNRPEFVPGTGRPAAALSLVDRDGNATWFGWGTAAGEIDPTQPVNAAEAIDMLLRALAGDTSEE